MNSMTIGQGPEAAAPSTVYRAPNSLEVALMRMKAEEDAKARTTVAATSAMAPGPVLAALSQARAASLTRMLPDVSVPSVSISTDPIREAVDRAVMAVVTGSAGNTATMKRYMAYFDQRIMAAMSQKLSPRLSASVYAKR